MSVPVSDIKFIVGLGNPGTKYKNTRHNLGFMFLDSFAEKEGLSWKNWNDMAGISFYTKNNSKILLAKPATFMNNSGFPAAALLKYYKIVPEQMLVVYDDFSIPTGEYRFRTGGSSGGHNGIGSIIQQTSSSNFPRLKIGMGPLPKFIKMPDFVLSGFTKEENEKLASILDRSKEIIDTFTEFSFDKAVSKISAKNL